MINEHNWPADRVNHGRFADWRDPRKGTKPIPHDELTIKHLAEHSDPWGPKFRGFKPHTHTEYSGDTTVGTDGVNLNDWV
jgi:hypothetical protein